MDYAVRRWRHHKAGGRDSLRVTFSYYYKIRVKFKLEINKKEGKKRGTPSLCLYKPGGRRRKWLAALHCTDCLYTHTHTYRSGSVVVVTAPHPAPKRKKRTRLKLCTCIQEREKHTWPLADSLVVVVVVQGKTTLPLIKRHKQQQQHILLFLRV